MSERITRENVETRCANVNRRMESRGSSIRYVVEGRNGGVGLDRVRRDPNVPINLDSRPGRYGWIVETTVTFGTKREVADFLHAMMVALDDASFSADQAIPIYD